MEDEKKVILLHESILQSWAKDFVAYGGMIGVLIINYFLLDNNKVTTFIFIVLFFVYVMGKNSKTMKENIIYNKKDALKRIDKIYK